MANDDNGQARQREEVHDFSVWKTNTVLTILLALQVILFDLISEDRTIGPRVIEGILGIRFSDVGAVPGLLLVIGIGVAGILAMTLFVYVAWNKLIVRLVNTRRIRMGHAYAVTVVLGFFSHQWPSV